MRRARLAVLSLAVTLAAFAMPARSAPFEWDEPGAVDVFVSFEPETPLAGETVRFYAVFKGTPLPGTVVTWSFPDAKIVGNPVRRAFDQPGKKLVEVHVWQPGIKPLTASRIVEVAEPEVEEGAVAVFFEVPEKVVTGVPVSFIAVFKGTPLEGAVVGWDFGAGELVYGNPVRHVFAEGGKQLVRVTLDQPGRRRLSCEAVVLVFPQRVEREWR
jgi:hypothetical protein